MPIFHDEFMLTSINNASIGDNNSRLSGGGQGDKDIKIQV